MRAIKDKLGAELKQLEHEIRVQLPKEISAAVAMGDLRENAEYKAALERQAFVRARIAQLRQRLGTLNSMNLSRIPRDRVGLGSVVTLLDLDSEAEVTYELVVPEMADLEKRLISVASPVGQSLIGKREGDSVSVIIPSGKRRYELLELRTLHGRPED